MKKMKIEEAVGFPIFHDMTMVVPGKYKGAKFKKGHIIKEEDIEVLKSMGKFNIYIGEIPDGYVHEEECAIRIANAICGDNFDLSAVSEGKVDIFAKYKGLFYVNKNLLYRLNSIKDVSISTIANNIVVEKGMKVASERIIPLFTEEQNIINVENICEKEKPISIKRLESKKVYMVVTGNEVFKGIIEDKFYPALSVKVDYYGSKIVNVTKVPDNKDMIVEAIDNAYQNGAEVILCTGGMSVDEDDLTPIAIKQYIDELIIHGAPVQPGNMFLLGYKGAVPIMGLPGAVMFYKNTIFDIVFPRVIAGEKLNKEFFLNLAVGGLCSFCNECHYPNCYFGK